MQNLDLHGPVSFGWMATATPVTDPRDGVSGLSAALVLAQYLLEVSQRRADLFADIRQNLLSALDSAGVPDVESARLGGITKQRVGAILKPRRMMRSR